MAAAHLVVSELLAETTTGLQDSSVCDGHVLVTLRVRIRSPDTPPPPTTTTRGEVQCREDSDGDLDVPRRPRRRRNGSAAGEESVTYTLESSSAALTWDAAGSQLWRAALLLAEFVHANEELFSGRTVLELGCGIGFASIVVSRFADAVFATDADVAALQLTKRNAERNSSHNVRARAFDWNGDLGGEDAAATPNELRWSQDDREAVRRASVVIASDVFYDDETTAAFLKTLRRLMLENPRLTAIVALEKRVVFSVVTMSAISLGFDAFQDHVCFHDAATSHREVDDAEATNQIECRVCRAEAEKLGADPLLKFVVQSVPLTAIPQAFEYDRVSTLMLWAIEKVVVSS